MQEEPSGSREPESLARRHFLAIGAFAAVVLFAQIALTRLFSVVQYYHGAFLAVSLALFGFAVSGAFVYLRSQTFTRERLDAAIAFYGAALAISIPVSFYFYLYLGIEPLLAWLGLSLEGSIAVAALEYAILAAPFFCAGVCISLLLFHGSRQANRLYAMDLSASAAGALIVIPVLSFFGGPKAMLFASAVAATATLPFLRALRRGRAVAPAVAVVALLAVVALPTTALNRLRLRKAAMFVASEPIRWNSFSMVGVGEESEVAGRHVRPIVIDNSVITQMVGSRGDPASDLFLKGDWNALAHRLRSDANVLIIGAGGGRDILVARAYDQKHVRAVEVNPLVVEMADETFGDFTGHVYSRPTVEKVIGDARSYIANSSEHFDIILASLIDTWAASTAGAFALTENLLYTTDAFQDYYEHLSDDGVLSISRWHPLETPRLLATGLDAWRQAGVEDPRQHAVMILTPPVAGFDSRIVILLMKKQPFTSEEIRTVEAFAAETGRIAALTPERVRDPVVAQYLAAAGNGGRAFPWPGIDIEPATDERPFFFNMVRPSSQLERMLGFSQSNKDALLGGFAVNLEATRMLIQLLVAVSLLLALTIFAPLYFRAGAVRGANWPAVL
ncbi:MAG: hypothetical protein V3U03_13945, partial [Myxococcota bacterium]